METYVVTGEVVYDGSYGVDVNEIDKPSLGFILNNSIGKYIRVTVEVLR